MEDELVNIPLMIYRIVYFSQRIEIIKEYTSGTFKTPF